MTSAVFFGNSFSSSSSALASLTRYDPHSVAHRHRHETPYVCVVLSGSFCQTAQFDRLASTGHFLVLPAGCWHSDRVGPSGSTCLNLHFDEDQANSLMEFSGKLSQRGYQIARDIADEIALVSDTDRFAVDALICELVAEVRLLQDNSSDHPAVDRLVDWIASEPIRPWCLSDAAQAVGLHPNHLARAFRRRTGQSIGAFRRAHLLLQLCLTIRSTNRPLAQIAAEFGFADQAHMTRSVTRKTGLSPGKYRRAWR